MNGQGRIANAGLLFLLLAALPLRAESIGVNFVDASINSRVPADAAAGFGAYAQSGWNNLTGKFPFDDTVPRRDDPGNLKNALGRATGCSVLWQVNTHYRLAGGTPTGDAFLRKAYLDSDKQFHEGVEVVAEGIPYARYDLVLYVDSDQAGRVGEARTGDQTAYFITLGGIDAPYQESKANAADQAKPANVVVFRGLTGRSRTFRIKAAKEGSSGNVGLQAFQIVEKS